MQSSQQNSVAASGTYTIAGTASVKHLEENVAGAHIGLSDEEFNILSQDVA